MAALASVGDLEARLGRSLTDVEDARVDALLDDASALVREFTGQSFDRVTGDVVVVRADGDVVSLPQRPVTAVTVVVAVGGGGVPDVPVLFRWDGLDEVVLAGTAQVINLPERWDDDYATGVYRVTYDHGADEPPPLVVARVCSMVLTALTTVNQSGAPSSFASETIGPYSYRYASGTSGLAVSLSQADEAALRRYRRSTGSVQLR